MIRLGSLCDRLETSGLLLDRGDGFDDQIEIDHLAIDSRKVGPRGLFVAIKGVDADGHLFIDKAVQNGAIAVVCEAMPADRDKRSPGVAFVHVRDTRAASAELAPAFYGDPSKNLTLIGITGTNGKTTVAFLCRHVLEHLGHTPGMIGTVEIRIADEAIEPTLTTPDPVEINRLLRRMVDAGCTSCAMEVSSHALHQERARGLAFDVGIFTNLTQDHLDYHETIDDYLAAKKMLFDSLSSEAAAVYNADDKSGSRMVEDTAAHRISYGLSSGCDVRGEILANRAHALEMRIDGAERTFRLSGRFNAYNLLATYAAMLHLGADAEDVLAGLTTAEPVPGRFEILHFDDDRTVIVDYAHTPDALENVLRTIRQTKRDDALLWCVFGCGGDRDREKRPAMGAVAEQLADRIVITSDNPRRENPDAIIADIVEGLTDRTRVTRITNRAEAIRYAAEQAAAGDVVLIAGKGHETYQIIGDEKRAFDDKQVAREAFAARAAKNSNPTT